jgi:hypothetical protein
MRIICYQTLILYKKRTLQQYYETYKVLTKRMKLSKLQLLLVYKIRYIQEELFYYVLPS